jgi:membrane protein
MTARRVLSVGIALKGAVNEFLTDNCPHLAAAISFYLLLSLFPLALAAISIFGLVLQRPDFAMTVTDAVTDQIPVEQTAQFVNGIITNASSNWQAAGIVAIVGLLWAGTAVFNAIRKSLNAAWGIRTPRPFLQERLMEFVMLIGLGALLLASIGITTAFRVIREASLPVFGDRFTDGGLIWESAVIATSVFVAFLGFLFLYKLVPNTRVRWRHAALGALAAAVMFEIVKNIFAVLVPDFATYDIVYGAVGIVVSLMIYAYVSAVILLFCAKLTSVYPKIRASLAAEALAEESAKEKLRKLTPAGSMLLVNMSSLTSGGVGALRRLMLGKG